MPQKRKKNRPDNRPYQKRRGGSSFGTHTAKSRPSAFPSAKRSGTPEKGPTFKSGFSTSRSSGGSGFSDPYRDKPKKASEVLLTRRNLLIGAAGIGGVALVGGLGSVALDSLSPKTASIDYLSVPESAVTNIDAFTEVPYEDCVSLIGNFRMPYGTLVWADNSTVAACLEPTDTASPLTTVSLLFLSTGNNPTVLDAAQGAEEGYEIYDVRCSADGMIWTEANIFENTWRIYTARLDGAEVGGIVKVDEGDGNWLTPSIAAVDTSAFWQVVPTADGEYAKEAAVLKRSTFGSSDVSVAYTSKRAFATRVTPVDGGVVITPRADSTSVYYQLTYLSSKDGSMIDQMTLPASMAPREASYGETGFSFAFDSIYSYGGGIANLGTYTPFTKPAPYGYHDLSWFHFGRTPSAPPAWCGSWLAIKSSRALCGIDLASRTYFLIDIPSATDTYGEYLVSSGTNDAIVGLCNITAVNDGEEDHALVRVWSPN